MKREIYLTVLIALFLVAFTPQTANAQKSKRSTVKVYTKKPYRVSRTKVIYKKPKRMVTSVRVIPNERIIKHKGVNYYFSNNRYYTYSGGRYIVIQPKIGFRINTLPVGYKIIRHRNGNYFWFNGIFYNRINNVYEVVEPEIGTVIYELPRDYERVEIDGNIYYEFSNVLYEKVQINGTRAYEVVGFID